MNKTMRKRIGTIESVLGRRPTPQPTTAYELAGYDDAGQAHFKRINGEPRMQVLPPRPRPQWLVVAGAIPDEPIW
jgi:hypothetical protein